MIFRVFPAAGKQKSLILPERPVTETIHRLNHNSSRITTDSPVETKGYKRLINLPDLLNCSKYSPFDKKRRFDGSMLSGKTPNVYSNYLTD